MGNTRKPSLSEQCKAIEDNNRIGKTRDHVKKIGDIKGTFHPKLSTINDRNSKDLTKAEDIKKRWQEYTEELYKKGLNDLGNLEPDVLDCEVKWAFESITRYKPSGYDGIQAELFKILKNDIALNMSGNLQNSTVVIDLEKVSFHSNPKERQCQRIFKLQYNCTHFT